MADFESILQELTKSEIQVKKQETVSPKEVKKKTPEEQNAKVAEKILEDLSKKRTYKQKDKLDLKIYDPSELTKVKDFNHLKELYPVEYQVDGSTLWVHVKEDGKKMKMSTRYNTLLSMLEFISSKFDGEMYFKSLSNLRVLIQLRKDNKVIQMVDNVHGTQKVYVWFDEITNKKEYPHYKKDAVALCTDVLNHFGIDAHKEAQERWFPTKKSEKK